jgi:adenine-specific DNA-methyltransferase
MINTHNFDVITSDQFERTIPKNGFDILIGNPPYLGEKGIKDLFNEVKKSSFGYQYYEGKMDLFYYFIYRGIHVLNQKGILVYLTTNYFITADGAKKLRKFLKNNGSFIEIINFNEYKLFDDAPGQHNLIFTYSKIKKNKVQITTIKEKKKVDNFKELISLVNNCSNKYSIDDSFLFNEREIIQLYINKNHFSIIKKIKSKSTNPLGYFFNVNQGLVSGADRVSKHHFSKKLSQEMIDLYKINIGDPIYIMDQNESNTFRENEYLKDFYKNSDIRKFSVRENTNKKIPH